MAGTFIAVFTVGMCIALARLQVAFTAFAVFVAFTAALFFACIVDAGFVACALAVRRTASAFFDAGMILNRIAGGVRACHGNASVCYRIALLRRTAMTVRCAGAAITVRPIRFGRRASAGAVQTDLSARTRNIRTGIRAFASAVSVGDFSRRTAARFTRGTSNAFFAGA